MPIGDTHMMMRAAAGAHPELLRVSIERNPTAPLRAVLDEAAAFAWDAAEALVRAGQDRGHVETDPPPVELAPDPYDQGRRDMLNALLALNPEVEAKLAALEEREPDEFGRIPFEVVYWVCSVAVQLGIEPPEAPEVAPSEMPAEAETCGLTDAEEATVAAELGGPDAGPVAPPPSTAEKPPRRSKEAVAKPRVESGSS